MNEEPAQTKPRTAPQAAEDDFGPWLAESAQPVEAVPRRPGQDGPAPADDSSGRRAWAWQPHRAGKGPLASVVTDPVTLAEPTRRQSAADGYADDRGFRSIENPTIVAVLLLAALVVAGAHALHCDLRRLPALRELATYNESIHDYNHARNVLARHLAHQRQGRLAQLRGYADWMAKRQEQGVVVYVPADNGEPVRRSVAKVDFGDLRRQVDHDIAEVEEWIPPMPLPSYDRLRFGTPELLTAHTPVVTAFACALASLIAWSFLAHRNLRPLQAPDTSFRAAYVPLCWLVPVLNVVLPCAAMGEIWHGSNPGRLRNPKGLRVPVIGFWWFLVVAGTVLMAVGVSRTITAIGVEQMAEATHFAVYAHAAAIVIGVLTAGLLVATCLNQSRRIRLVATLEETIGAGENWRSD